MARHPGSSQIAIDNGETIANVFKAVETVANAGEYSGHGYWNLIFHYGVERFARDLKRRRCRLITPDLIPDEAMNGSRPPIATVLTASSWYPGLDRRLSEGRGRQRPWIRSCMPQPAWV